MIYLYAFTDGEAPAQPGLGDGRVEVLRHGRAAAVIGTVDESPPPEPAALWRHEAVVEGLDHGQAVLPVRFGTVLQDEAAVRALLARHEDVLAQGLEQVRGHVEVAVRIRAVRAAPPGAPTATPGRETGRDYLLRRRAEVHDLVDAAEAVHRDLRGRARAAVSRRRTGSRELLVCAYLVARGEVDAFASTVRALPVEEHGLQLVSTGPWPPYHFVPALEGALGA